MFRKISMISAVLLLTAGLAVQADQVKLNVALGNPVLPAGQSVKTYLKVSLTGFPLEKLVTRSPVNLALVIDISGSMQGDKILKAKEAAKLAISQLSHNDIVSVIIYSSSASILVPATKLTDKASVYAQIDSLQAGGSTALYAGISKGAHEIRKFFADNRINRAILISDGKANVGPSSPAELGSFGASLIKEGVSVSTIGLGGGYNEDLMSVLAEKSDGSHYFAENAVDLVGVFKSELGDVLSVVAQEVCVTIDLTAGIKPLRVLGRSAVITGQTVSTRFSQLCSKQEKYLILEVEVPPMSNNDELSMGSVSLTYTNMKTHTTDRLASTVSARFSESEAQIEKAINKKVVVSAVEQIATITNEQALSLRDQGKVKEAKDLLRSNGEFLRANGKKLSSKVLIKYAEVQKEDEENMDENWTVQRKRMREVQIQKRSQSRSSSGSSK